MPTRIGELRHRITVQRYTATQNGLGEQVRTWAPLLATRAAVETVGGDGRLETVPQQDLASVSYRIRIRYRTDATPLPKDQVVWGAKTLNVESVTDPTGLGREYVLMCTEILG